MTAGHSRSYLWMIYKKGRMKFVTDADLGLVQSKLKIISVVSRNKRPSTNKAKKENGFLSRQTTLDLYYVGNRRKKISKKEEEYQVLDNGVKNVKMVSTKGKQTIITTDYSSNRIIFK